MVSAGLIIGTVVVAVVGIIPVLGLLSDKNTLGSELERFIVSRNPQTAADIERLQLEYAHIQARNRFI